MVQARYDNVKAQVISTAFNLFWGSIEGDDEQALIYAKEFKCSVGELREVAEDLIINTPDMVDAGE